MSHVNDELLAASQAAILAVFNQPLAKQPRYLAHIGCADGVLLKHCYTLICQHSRRGEMLEQWPLSLIAIVGQPTGVATMADNLQGLPHSIVFSTEVDLTADMGEGNVLYLYHDSDDYECWQLLFAQWARRLHIHGWLVLARHHAVAAELFLLMAANAGLFARTQPIRLPKAQPICQFSLSHFDRHDYRIRHAQSSDLTVLAQLEQQCWLPALQTSATKLAERLDVYPQGQFVLELDGQVVGVIYSQRILDRQLLLTVSVDTAECLHQADAPVVHLIAVNIRPDMQQRALGDRLLEFMLQRCSLMEGVVSVTAVTRCKDYQADRDGLLGRYIRQRNAQGRLLDPVLRFHELHGACIEGLVPAYRPLDHGNQGNGVLVHYDIHQRQRDEWQTDVTINTVYFSSHQIKEFVTDAIKRCLGDKLAAFAPDRGLMAMGLDSADLLQLGEYIGGHYQSKLEPAFFFHYSTPEKIIAYLGKRLLATETSAIVQAPASIAQDIAIIGMSGSFPMAKDLAELWENLAAGKHCISEIPPERWLWQAISPELAWGGNTTSNSWGGFIDGIAAFDADFFNIPPRDAQCMDPQLRLLIQHIWLALEEGGLDPDVFAQTPTGVFVAAAPNDYRHLLANADQHPEDGTTLFSSAIANRISQLFDLQGPSECYEAACASSLLAIHHAVVALQQRECEQAVVAAVNLLITPTRHQAAEALGYLSADGQARSFQAEANGFVRAEGVGAVLLKPLAHALAAGDHIHAVIKGTAAIHGGKGLSLTAPNPAGMKAAMVKAYRVAGIDSSTVSYIEAHGVASPLGDVQEIHALKTAYQELTQGLPSEVTAHPVYVSTVKPCIGHTELASGLAALLKVVLAMRHQTILGLPHFTQLHPQICLQDSPLHIAREHHAWQVRHDTNGKPLPRSASINGYGDAGVNAHLVLQEFRETRDFNQVETGRYLIVLSAQTEVALVAVVARLGQFLRESEHSLADVSYTLQVGRKALAKRLALIVDNHQHLFEALQDYQRTGQIPTYADTRIYSGNKEMVWLQEAWAANHLEVVAAYWLQGGSIPWARFYQGKPVRRLSLPTYPFATTSYWWTDSKCSTASGNPNDGAIADADFSTFLQQQAADILGINFSLPPDKPLYAAGFTSLHALSLKAVLEQQYQIAFPVCAIDVYCPLAELAEQLKTRLATSVSASPTDGQLLPVLKSDPAQRYQPFPLSDIQQAFLLGRKLGHADSQVGCHIYLEIDFAALDIYRLNQSWNRLLAYHDMLRAVFADGQQCVLAQIPHYLFKVIDLRRQGTQAQTDALDRLRLKMSHQVYQPEIWPLFEIRISLSQTGYRLHFSIDELIADATSVELLFQQWQQLYEQPETTLPNLELSFRDYMLAMQAFASSPRYRQDLGYWLDKLAVLPAGPQLPMTTRQSAERVRLAQTVAAPQWQTLKARASLLKVSPTALLLAVFSLILQSRSETPCFTLILTLFNRWGLHPQIGQVFAPFISTTLFAVEDSGGCSFEAFIGQIQANLFADLDHSSVSGIQALRELKHSKCLTDTPPLPVVFTSLLGTQSGRGSQSFLEQVGYCVTQTPQVLLDHQLYEQDGELRLSWDVANAYFPNTSMESLFADYGRLLAYLANAHVKWHEPIADLIRLALPFRACPSKQRVFALTDQQQAYAFAKSTYGAGISSQFYSCFEIEQLDVPRLQQAWQKLLATHEALRMVINPDGTQTRLETLPPYEIIVHDWCGGSPVDKGFALKSLAKNMLAGNCPLGSWPYFNIQVSLLDADKSRVHFCMELLIADVPSISLVQQQLFYYYRHPDETPPNNTVCYSDYLWALQNSQQNAHYHDCIQYWEKKFADIPGGPKLPAGNPAISRSTVRLNGLLTHWGGIKAMASSLSVSPSIVLLAAYAQVLAAWSETPAFTLVMPIWQREPIHTDIDGVVGDFTTMSWVTVVNDTTTFAQKVSCYQQTVHNDLAHRAVSGLKILRKLAMRQRLDRTLGFPVVFTDFEPCHAELWQGFRLCVEMSQTAFVDLDCLSSDQGGRLVLHWDVAQGRYPDGLVQDMFAVYQRLLVYLADCPQAWQETDFSFLIKPHAVGNG
ncbi:MAG: beta-ketoacyl synthase N-terminal-like domain-containing protein [Methylovulum sp.]|nr:beta-ketoacyl synthase N-terminal-like domain-containing protein [Methylovulum sp.]